MKKGSKHTPEARERMRQRRLGVKPAPHSAAGLAKIAAISAEAMRGRVGAVHNSWKGDDASYSAIHRWIGRHFPRVGRCEYCGGTDKPTCYASADHRYTRNRTDWFELCYRCHSWFDGHGAKVSAAASRRRDPHPDGPKA